MNNEINRKSVFMAGLKKKFGYVFTTQDLEEVEIIIDWYEKQLQQLERDNKLLKELKAKFIDDDGMELTYDLGDYLSAIDCYLEQNAEIWKLRKQVRELKLEGIIKNEK